MNTVAVHTVELDSAITRFKVGAAARAGLAAESDRLADEIAQAVLAGKN